jgi:two-component system KDP operon response regulator KdpE
MAVKILIVDKDPEMASILQRSLVREDYVVEVVQGRKEALRRAYAFQPDLVLLDLAMPGADGWDLLGRIRELSDVPVIILSAVDDEDDKVRAFDLGADDYVTKPFGMQELKARIHAVLRRASLPPSKGSYLLRFDDDQLVLDPSSRKVTLRGESVDLTPTEYKLFLYLAYNSGRVLTHGQILEGVWGVDYETSLPSVKVYISRLRDKLEPNPREPRYILTQRGSGYYLSRD